MQEASTGNGAAVSTELLDHRGLGVAHLDRRGRVVAVNDRCRALFNARNGLRNRGGRLRAASSAENARLKALVARALPGDGRAGVPGAMRVSRGPAESALVVHVKPVSRGEDATLGALVLVDDPAARSRFVAERIAAALDLTPTESAIAALVAQGMGIDAIAAWMVRRRTTVKWHLRQIFAKHGLTRQTELAHLVVSLDHVADVRP